MFKNAKFEATGETKTAFGVTLYQIRAVAAITSLGIAIGDAGGWIEKETNLSVSGNAWVSGDAQVLDDARIKTYNIIATRTDGYTFMVAPTPDGPRIMAGCRYFTFEEAETHWAKTRGGTPLGEESLALVAHLKRMAEINGFMEPVAE